MHKNIFTHQALRVLSLVEFAGLAVITIATVVAMIGEAHIMIEARAVTLADLLLMFLYLEVLAMVGMYFESGKLPVRFPIYIAIVALARYLVLDMKNLDQWDMIGVASSILLLTLAVLAIRFGHVRLPYSDNE